MVLLLVAIVVFALDRLSKAAVQRIPLHTGYDFFGGFVSIVHFQNTGAAFSLGLGMGRLFLLFAVLASGGIIYAYRHLPQGEPLMRLALGLILGGAVGNAFDSVTSGSVTDFIDLHWFPIFNVADSCIVVGATVLAFRLWWRQRTDAEA